MADISSVSSQSAAIVRTADQNTAVAATLLKKVMDADKNLVSTLLPAQGSQTGRVNISA